MPKQENDLVRVGRIFKRRERQKVDAPKATATHLTVLSAVVLKFGAF